MIPYLRKKILSSLKNLFHIYRGPRDKVILLKTKYQKIITRRRFMKKIILVSTLILSFIIVPAVVCNAKTNALGIFHFGAKVDYISFTDDFLKDADVDTGVYLGAEIYDVDTGVYLGAEIYSIILPYLYLGLEAGYSNPSGTYTDAILGNVDTELTYVPVELNAKVAFEPVKNLAIDVGGGVAINYAEMKGSILGVPVTQDDWLWGGQFFADINYIAGGVVYIGINGKYKFAEKGLKDYDVTLNNWMIGGQIGVKF
jgi:hypothetical protein